MATELPESSPVTAAVASGSGTREAAGAELGGTPGRLGLRHPPHPPHLERGIRRGGRGCRLAQSPSSSPKPSRPERGEGEGLEAESAALGRDPNWGGTRHPRGAQARGAVMERAGPGSARPRDQDSVEAWLDDHWDFTFSYFVRKATR